MYSEGRTLFSQPDYLSNTPLEAAYSWVLSCKSYIHKDIELGGMLFRIHCENLLPKRIFPGGCFYLVTSNSYESSDEDEDKEPPPKRIHSNLDYWRRVLDGYLSEYCKQLQMCDQLHASYVMLCSFLTSIIVSSLLILVCSSLVCSEPESLKDEARWQDRERKKKHQEEED